MNNLPGKEPVVYFGKTDFRNSEKIFGLKKKDRRQHMYIIGKSGTGKSALLRNLIVQDVENGEGVCVVDPHGELVEEILETIPESRKNDVVYFNPADEEYSIGFNILELPDPKYKHLVASGMMGIFTKIWANVWSARMEYIMNNAILALLDTPGTTLLGIPRLLTDKEYRQKIINNLKDPVVKAFWVNEYEQWQDKFRNEAIAPIQNKVGQFLSTAMVRNIVGQKNSSIDIFELMNDRKILIVNVSKGRIGEDASALLGAMLITKIQLAAMERVRIPEDERRDFYLYVDEFQNFATDSFASVLSEARKYRLNLIVAHQYIGQLVTNDGSTAVRDAIFGNVGTMLMFRVGVTDAEFLESEFSPTFTVQDMINLPNWHIYLKLLINGQSSKPFSAMTLPPLELKYERALSVEEVVETSRKNYSQKTKKVERDILTWSSGSDVVEVAEFSEEDEFNKKALSSIGNNKKDGFVVNCAVCGKEENVPFKPISGKPVYCRSCHKKVQEGLIPPVVKQPKKAPKSKWEESSKVLASMGVEFELSNNNGANNKGTSGTGSKISSNNNNFSVGAKKINGSKNKHKNKNKSNRKFTKEKSTEKMKEALKDILADLKKDSK